MWSNNVSLELMEVLGEGGQGCVYKALRRDREAKIEQTVAVKILHSQTTVELWRLEFESLAKIRSQYCVRVLSFERVKGRPALILEYIDGASLSQIAQFCELDASNELELLAQIERALVDLHSYGIIHGDLSPQNIMIDRTGEIRLLDFGLANCADSELRVTPRFAAPERMRGEPPSVGTDLYSLGCIANYLFPNSRLNKEQYLDPDPDKRQLYHHQPSIELQAKLALRVQSYLNAKEIDSKARTQLLDRPLKSHSMVCNFLALAFASLIITSAPTASSLFQQSQISSLTIRTKNWYTLTLNGKPLGYSPVFVPLEKGHLYQLEWTSANGSGIKRWTAGLNENLVLSDSDFLH